MTISRQLMLFEWSWEFPTMMGSAQLSVLAEQMTTLSLKKLSTLSCTLEAKLLPWQLHCSSVRISKDPDHHLSQQCAAIMRVLAFSAAAGVPRLRKPLEQVIMA